jgi:ADP-heptose:LPS heptosyltransferase
MPKPGDKVLWIRFGAFGDVLQAVAGAARFKEKYPYARLFFLTRPEYADILKAQPCVDDVILWDVKKRPLGFLKAIKEIREKRFDWLFSLHRGGAAALTALFGGVSSRRCYGYNSGMQFCYKATHWERLHSLGVEFTNRETPAIFTTPEDRETAASMLAGLRKDSGKIIFAVIGASKPQKFWPVRHWIDFLTPLASEGWGVILNGHGEEEMRTALAIEEALSKAGKNRNVKNLVGQAPFPLMAALAEASTVAVGNDTGPLHLAALVGTPTLGFFGVTDSFGMNFRMPWFREVRVTCPKAGCRDYGCPIDCLADVTPEKALAAFREFAPIIASVQGNRRP